MTRRGSAPGDALSCPAMRHLFVCTSSVASGKPACGRRGGDAVAAAVSRVLLARADEVIE